MYTHVSLFAGLGGFIMAAKRNNIRTVFANEIEQTCCTVLNYNFRNETVINGQDIRNLNPNDYSELAQNIDILSAGFPCQSFSQAGENLGFDDERGKLFFEITRLCEQMEHYPKIILLENVPFLKIFDSGSRLRTVINELRRIGYWISDVNTEILDSYNFGVTPQKRERLFMVAVHSHYFKKNKFNFPKVVRATKPVDLWKIIDRSQRGEDFLYLDPENKYARMILKSAYENGKDRLFQVRRTEVRACPVGVCPTLTANMGMGGHNVPFVIDGYGIRRLNIQEMLALQCIDPSEFKFPAGITENAALTMIGNALCVDLVDLIFYNIRNMLSEVYNDERKLEFS